MNAVPALPLNTQRGNEAKTMRDTMLPAGTNSYRCVTDVTSSVCYQQPNRHVVPQTDLLQHWNSLKGRHRRPVRGADGGQSRPRLRSLRREDGRRRRTLANIHRARR